MDPIPRLVAADAISRVGDAVTAVALPLTAVLLLGASPAGLALIGVAQAVPILVFSLVTGAWVDRRSRRWPILVCADLARAAVLLGVPMATVAGVLSLPLLAAVAFAVALAGTFFDVAMGGWLPRLVGGDRLHLANARIELARSAAGVGGPTLGGALVSLLTAPFALIADALSFVISAGLVITLRNQEPSWPPAATSSSLRSDVLTGLRFVAAQPYVRAVVATAGINNLSRSIALGVVVLYLVGAGLTAAEIGLAFGIGNLGFIAGALLSRRLPRRLGIGLAMQLAVSLFGPSMLLFAAAPQAWAGPAFAFAAFANTFGIAVHNVSQVTVRQLLTPDELRGRVASVTRLVIFGAIPVGTVIGGAIAEGFGLRAALVVSAIGLFLGPVPYLLTRITRIRSVEQLAV